jgi:hypothetical protein
MNKLKGFRKIHQDSSIVVCGCGESLNDLAEPERFITIGVNDVGRRFQPNYLVVVNPPNQFSGDRFRFVETSQAEYVFTQLDLGINHPNIVKFQLGTFGGTEFFAKDVLHYTNNSPYIALCLAILMGARRIGLIGVDFTDHHFFAKTGRHPLTPQLDSINEQYHRLAEAAKSHGIEIFNLSRISRLTAFPKISLDEFSAPDPTDGSHHSFGEKSTSLKIVSYATTPVAGVPAILARCINAQTGHGARCVWMTNSYGSGVEFAGDVEWRNQPQLAEILLTEADLVIVHNGKVAAEHERFFAGKAVVTMAHNYLWNVDERFVRRGLAGVVVGQYQAVLDEFKDWLVVPNPVPFWEDDYKPENKPDQITICFTPSGKHEKYPPDHKLYWHSKGYETTIRVLEKIARRLPVKLEIIRKGQIPHAESLAMKRRSHIVIDECVTGSYHRNSLEGLACGAVVVNGLGILPEVADVLRLCAAHKAEIPFESATLENLEEVLTRLVESGRENLVKKGAENRVWLENHWDFSRQWQRFWIPAIERSLAKVNRNKSFAKTVEPENILSGDVLNPEMKEFKKGVSVVIPHGGQNRLPHLRACLANLRQCGAVGEIIVVEMDKTPQAAEIVRKWADKYVFIHRANLFERARTLNLGSAFAGCEVVLWLDNDLLVPTDFLSSAVAEMRASNLDFLLPFSEIKYLSFADSEKVMRGTLGADACEPIKIYTNTMTDGGCGLVRAEFLQKYGGIPKGFKGWGGEDNGWMHKVNRLGKSGRTNSRQTVFHIYHPLSGGNGGDLHILANPQYQKNLENLEKIRNISDPEVLLTEFPPEQARLCENARKIYLIGEQSAVNFPVVSTLQKDLSARFGVEAEIVSVRNAKRVLAKQNAADAVVFFDDQTALKFIREDCFAPLLEKTIVISDGECALTTNGISNSPKVFAILTENEEKFSELEKSPAKDSIWRFEPENSAAALAQPLSILLNSVVVEEEKQPVKIAAPAKLPVWFYWEGQRPRWIEICHETIVANSTEARFLTPESFNELWTTDRDINLSRLYVAHRADFIRSYLLAKFGGLWVDADCLVMRKLSGLLEKLGEFDFLAHRERGGFFSNGFMGAKKDSLIARELYKRICRFLRENRRISWLEIGSKPLTDILHKTDAPFLELDCEQIQPVCWSQPEKFFALGSDAAHERNFNQNAICYMLSNGAVINYQSRNQGADLTAENSFFSFAARRALKKGSGRGSGIQIPDRKAANNGNRLKLLTFYLEMFAGIAPRKVVDADVGSGRWAVLLRDFFESSCGIKIEALVDKKVEKDVFHRAVYDRVKVGGLEEWVKNSREKEDLLILGDYLTRNGNFQNPKILEDALNNSDYALLNFYRSKNGFQPTASEKNLLEFLSANSAKIAAIQKNGTCVSVLLSRNDPKKIRRASADFADVFRQMTENYARSGEESLAGPGCSLKSTAEIRRALPLLFSFLGINSMLDARCGDFNWLRRVDLRLEKYYGVDIVPSAIERNRNLYQNRQRKFILADARRDFLPETDLILCRDLLVHLAFEDIFSALRNFSASGAKYLLTTTFPNTPKNAVIKTGEWRTLNLQIPPFDFGAPLELINERCAEGGGQFTDKSLGLWLISDIKELSGKF